MFEVKLNKKETRKFVYLRVEFIADKYSAPYKPGYNEIYFKCNVIEFEQLKIGIMFNKVSDKDNLSNRWSIDASTRNERLYRDIGHILNTSKVIGIYKFDLSENILKRDIKSKIDKYLLENRDKPISDYKVYI